VPDIQVSQLIPAKNIFSTHPVDRNNRAANNAMSGSSDGIFLTFIKLISGSLLNLILHSPLVRFNHIHKPLLRNNNNKAASFGNF